MITRCHVLLASVMLAASCGSSPTAGGTAAESTIGTVATTGESADLVEDVEQSSDEATATPTSVRNYSPQP